MGVELRHYFRYVLRRLVWRSLVITRYSRELSVLDTKKVRVKVTCNRRVLRIKVQRFVCNTVMCAHRKYCNV